ncbi:MAG: ABC transporter permease [Deltaproteobacteria bacterium]|nr:ABC transporter permease [Deltaproteobacteria bacterium]
MKILLALVKKESKEIFRDPVTLGIAVFFPVVMLFLFGYAISLDIKEVSMGIYDQERTQESAGLVEAFTGSGYFRVDFGLNSFREVDLILDRGQAAMVLVVPPDFSRLVNSSRKATVQVLLDGTFSARALIISNYATSIINRYSHDLMEKYLAGRG